MGISGALKYTPQEYVEAFSIPEPNSGCWIWLGPVGQRRSNYGKGKYRGTNILAHRFSYEAHRGPIPDGYEPDHLCRVTVCVNPQHMELVTSYENFLRSNGPAAVNARRTHCIQGHILAGDNLHITKSGKRVCRSCARIRSLAGYHKNVQDPEWKARRRARRRERAGQGL